MINEEFLIGLIKKALLDSEMPEGTSIDCFTTSPKVDNELGVVIIDDADDSERTFNIRVLDCDYESADEHVKSLGE